MARPHGLDGSFRVAEATPRLLCLGAPLRVGGRNTEITRRAGTEEWPIVRLGLAADRAAVEALRGEQLLAPRTAAPALEEGEYWAEDLEGCAVAAGEWRLGTVARLVALPSCEALELDGGLLVPLVGDAVRRIDVAGRRIEVDADFLRAALGRPDTPRRDQDAGPDAPRR